MPKKKNWKAWNIDMIKEHKKCAGDVPPTGSMEDKLTEQEFIAMARASGIHEWNSCHYVDEILGLAPVDGMKELPIHSDPKELLKTVETLVDPMREVDQSKKLVEFQNRLHAYVDRIVMKKGNLDIPHQLLKLADYADKFFN